MRSGRGAAVAGVMLAASALLASCTGTGTGPAPSGTTETTLTVNPACPADATPVGPTTDDLTDALAHAAPGDTLALSEVTYTGTFEITTSGTADAPIVLCGSSSSVLDGGSLDSGYALHLSSADYWQLVGFGVTNAAKGIMLDASSHNVLTELNVSRIGEEGIHLRAGSSENVIESSHISDTGLSTAEYGEGVYIGSAESNWCRYTACEPDMSDGNIIRDNTILDTTAEAIDVKEGTSDGQILGNALTLPATAVVESAVNLKGNEWIVDANTVEAAAGDGIRIHSVLEDWGAGNTVTANTLASGSDRLDIEVVGDARELGNVVGCDNRSASGGAATTNVTCQ